MYALIAILTSSLAWSADCDGLDQTPVVPSFSDVAIGESVYPLTRGRWKLLREDLVACGADQPADDLRRWITRRQLSAWSTLGGWYTSPLIVGFAVSARINRTRFENDLSEWTYSPEISPSGHIEMPSTEARRTPTERSSAPLGGTFERVQATWLSQTHLQEEENKRATGEMRSPDQIKETGYVLVVWQRVTIDAADAKWFTVGVIKDGQVVYRETGDAISFPPNYRNNGSMTVWYDSVVVPVPENIALPIDVQVFDSLSSTTYKFRIDASGVITGVSLTK